MPPLSQKSPSMPARDVDILMRAMRRQGSGGAEGPRSGAGELPHGSVAEVIPLDRGRSPHGSAGAVAIPAPHAAPQRRGAPRGERSGRGHRREAAAPRAAADDGRPTSRAGRSARGRHGVRRERSGGPLGAVASWFMDRSPIARRLMISGTVLVALVAFFYGPTCDLYAAARDHERLVERVEAVNAVADDLKAEVERLQTEEGVMDEARVRGYAPADEIAGDASKLIGADGRPAVPELSKPIETSDDPWLVQALDVLLGYQGRVS